MGKFLPIHALRRVPSVQKDKLSSVSKNTGKKEVTKQIFMTYTAARFVMSARAMLNEYGVAFHKVFLNFRIDISGH